MARSQYSIPTEGKRSRSDDPRGLSEYIRETAKKYGVDPEVALKVAKSEGLRDFSGDGGKSGGAFQLYTGGGLGNTFKKDTGLDPLDPANEKATIDYALKHAAKNGWKPWHGAAKVGVGEFDGISGGKAAADPATGYGGIGSDATASERAATTIKGTDTDTSTPEVAQTAPAAAPASFIDKLQDPKGNASQGLGEAISGVGQAFASTGLNKGMYDTPRAATIAAPGMMTPAIVPAVDPRAAEGQRQQLALAMQRLNSGKLY